jgi:hypothetical protein
MLRSLLGKEQLDNEDRTALLEHIERKHRIIFTPKFPSSQIKWVVVKGSTIIDRNYDCSKKSFYLVRGTIKIYERGCASKQDSDLQFMGKLIADLDKEGGIGMVFSDKNLPKCVVVADRAVIL